MGLWTAGGGSCSRQMDMGKTRLPKDFEITDAMRLWAAEKTPLVDIDQETEKFVDYWLACGKTMADWEATWRNWMRRCTTFKGASLKPMRLRSPEEIEAEERKRACH